MCPKVYLHCAKANAMSNLCRCPIATLNWIVYEPLPESNVAFLFSLQNKRTLRAQKERQQNMMWFKG